MLRRLLNPGGKLYVTVHDNHSVDFLDDRGFVTNNSWWGAIMAEFNRVTAGKPLSEFQTVVVVRGGPSMDKCFTTAIICSLTGSGI